MLLLLAACTDEPARRPGTGSQTTGDTAAPAPDAPCDGEGTGEAGCALSLADADQVLTGVPLRFVADLGGDGRDDAWQVEIERGGSYHSTWRDATVRVWPDVLAAPDRSIVVTSRASVTRPYEGTDSGTDGLASTPDVTGDGLPDAWFHLALQDWVLVPGPLEPRPGDPEALAVASADAIAATTDLDHDGVGELVPYDVSVRCEGPFEGTVDDECTAGRYPPEAPAWSLSLRQADVDFDGDGFDDPLVLEWLLDGEPSQPDGYATLAVRSGDPAADWMEPLSIVPLGSDRDHPALSAAADLDGDGFGDLAWIEPLSSPEVIQVHRGPLDPVLAFATADLVLRADGPVRPFAHGDVEGDGLPELLVLTSGGARVVHAAGRGEADLDARSYVLAEGEPLDGGVIAEVDGDDRADVLLARGEQVYVFLGRSLSAR